MAAERYPWEPDYAVPPGQVLEEWLTAHCIPHDELPDAADAPPSSSPKSSRAGRPSMPAPPSGSSRCWAWTPASGSASRLTTGCIWPARPMPVRPLRTERRGAPLATAAW